MKKDLIFAPLMLLVGAALFLLSVTGMTAHIVISVAGILLLAAYTALTVKGWRIKPLEIGMRACYGIALISGIVIMKVRGILFLAVLHKVCAALFVVSLAALLICKLVASKKA